MYFTNRQDAAAQLSNALIPYRGTRPLILAIPRGAVPMGEVIARELKGDLDVILVHKIGDPMNPELAIGAVTEEGEVYVHPNARLIGYSEKYIRALADRQMEMLRIRRKLYTPHRSPIAIEGRTVILVDDGIATGSTMISAIHDARMRKAKKIIVATAVAPLSVIEKLEREADEVVVLHAPEDFRAVGEFFGEFSPVEENEVTQILKNVT